MVESKLRIYRHFKPKRAISLFNSLICLLLVGILGYVVCQPWSTTMVGAAGRAEHPVTAFSATTLNPAPPTDVVKLIFIHHSTGEDWLADWHGGLGRALGNNNYFVSDTNYGWGPDNIGDTTDIGHWWLWFRGPASQTYLEALYGESNRHSSYPRWLTDPGGANEIIMFKSCFPNSALAGSPTTPPTTGDNPLRGEAAWSEHHTIANAKGIYNDILAYFATRQDKLFIVITAPPLQNGTYAANARAFNNWLVNNWLDNYPYHNVAVFDFYNVLTTNGGQPNLNDFDWSTGNHHRVVTTTTPVTIEHLTNGDDDSTPDVLEYPTGPSNDHPTAAGDQKATGEFVPLLNIYYHCWKYGQCGPEPGAGFTLAVSPPFRSIKPGQLATYTVMVTGLNGFKEPAELAVAGLSPGITPTWSHNPVVPGNSSLLTLATLQTVPFGLNSISIMATAGAYFETETVSLFIQAPYQSYLPLINKNT